MALMALRDQEHKETLLALRIKGFEGEYYVMTWMVVYMVLYVYVIWVGLIRGCICNEWAYGYIYFSGQYSHYCSH